VAARFVVEELAAFDNDRPGLRLRGAESAAGGTGLLGGQVQGLLVGGLFEGPRGQSGGSGSGDLFHGVQIDVEARPLVAESASDNDFSPLFGQSVDLGQVLVIELAGRHIASLIQLAPMGGGALSSP
jgi:hypothetical protein